MFVRLAADLARRPDKATGACILGQFPVNGFDESRSAPLTFPISFNYFCGEVLSLQVGNRAFLRAYDLLAMALGFWSYPVANPTNLPATNFTASSSLLVPVLQ